MNAPILIRLDFISVVKPYNRDGMIITLLKLQHSGGGGIS